MTHPETLLFGVLELWGSKADKILFRAPHLHPCTAARFVQQSKIAEFVFKKVAKPMSLFLEMG